MNSKFITTVLLGIMGGFGMSAAAAQEVLGQTNSQQTVVEEVKANRTTNYWYIEAASGVQTIFSSDAHLLSFGKRLTPLYSLTAGKWVGPYVGFRLQTQGYAFNGFSTTEGLYPVGDGTYGP